MSAAAKSGDKLGERLRARAAILSPSLVKVLEFIDAHRDEAMNKSAVELAAEIGTSDATVIRAVQALGFDGLKELRGVLATASGTGQTAADTIARTVASIKQRSANGVDYVLADHQETFSALASDETRADILAAVDALAPARRIGVFGIASTAFIARYFALSLTRTGRPTAVFDACLSPLPEQLLEMCNVDVLIMLAYGQPYKEAMSTIAEARRQKVPIVLISDTKDTAMARHTAVTISVSRGHAGHVAMHGTTFVCLEAIIFALAADDPAKAVSTVEKLGELRKSVRK